LIKPEGLNREKRKRQSVRKARLKKCEKLGAVWPHCQREKKTRGNGGFFGGRGGID